MNSFKAPQVEVVVSIKLNLHINNIQSARGSDTILFRYDLFFLQSNMYGTLDVMFESCIRSSELERLAKAVYTEIVVLVEKALFGTLEATVGNDNITVYAPCSKALKCNVDTEFTRFPLEPRNLGVTEHTASSDLLLSLRFPFDFAGTPVCSLASSSLLLSAIRTSSILHLHPEGLLCLRLFQPITMVSNLQTISIAGTSQV
ncbi:hypothetical protein KSP40_PGU021011 [Platanthera guangdongensis]|uniref:Uncharacterized protein n=1 Tax=Platanthera guangdongensis TaxID=2320717 RepID=A0ABR2M0J0_9ASPA